MNNIIESLREDLTALHESGAMNKAMLDEFDAAHPPERVKLGSRLASIARESGGLTPEESELFNQRDKAMTEPLALK